MSTHDSGNTSQSVVKPNVTHHITLKRHREMILRAFFLCETTSKTNVVRHHYIFYINDRNSVTFESRLTNPTKKFNGSATD